MEHKITICNSNQLTYSTAQQSTGGEFIDLATVVHEEGQVLLLYFLVNMLLPTKVFLYNTFQEKHILSALQIVH